jgi:anti-sigma factor RsiW
MEADGKRGETMNRPDHNTYREWLYLDADGELPRDQQARLETHLAACVECRREREELAALAALLERSSIPVRPDFRTSVVAALPATGWESRHPRNWRFPAAVLVLLGGLAAAFGLSGSPGQTPSALEALFAVGGMFRAATLAGAGLLNASWKGLTMVFGEMLDSPLNVGVFGVFVLCLNLLLISLIRRRKPAPSEAVVRPSDDGDGTRD